jgi:hypothetical protein
MNDPNILLNISCILCKEPKIYCGTSYEYNINNNRQKSMGISHGIIIKYTMYENKK